MMRLISFLGFFIFSLVFCTAECLSSSIDNAYLPSRDISIYKNIKTIDGVSVAVDIFDTAKIKQTFGVDLIRKKIQPLYVIIQNKSSSRHWFSKAGSDKTFIPSGEVPRMVYEGVFSRFLKGGTFGMLKWPFLVPGAMIDKGKSGIITRRIKNKASLEEIPDVYIEPGGEIQGMMFVSVKPDNKIVIKVTSSQNLKKKEFTFEKERGVNAK